jgi:NADP-dependent 3-hydroxy acid dehydrogenase YdfG
MSPHEREGIYVGDAFDTKVVVVTGAASGIGAALCRSLADRGARVVGFDCDAAGLASSFGDDARIETATLDVCDADAFAALVADVVARHGRLDLLFNNAGIGLGGEVRDLQVSDWDPLLDVNVRGVINGIAAAYPVMLEQGCGHIVNTASLAGLVPLPGEAPYVASKYAVVGLSHVLRAEGRQLGVRCTVVCPGKVETPIYDTSPVLGVDRDRVLALWPKGVTPQRCAEVILQGVARNRGTVVVSAMAKALVVVHRISPAIVERASQRYLAKIRPFRLEDIR